MVDQKIIFVTDFFFFFSLFSFQNLLFVKLMWFFRPFVKFGQASVKFLS